MYTITKPSILLIGSGILQAFGKEGWDKFLDSINTRHDLPIETSKINCPSPLKAIIVTGDQVDTAMKKKFSGSVYEEISTPELVSMLQDILSVGFDHILTTNYTYELEEAAVHPKKLTRYRLTKMQKCTGGRAEGKYLLHTYMELPFRGKQNKLWHIHGEARKPDSVVLGHYYYGNLLSEIKKEVQRIDECRWKGRDGKNASWIDAFLFGDVYCIGFGFGLCEFDLWWLLNRKAREKGNTGKMYFYDPASPDTFDAKLDLLKLMKTASGEPLVDTIDLGYKKETDMDWRKFYIGALNDVKVRIETPESDETFNRQNIILV